MWWTVSEKSLTKCSLKTDSTSGVFEDELLVELAFQQGNVLLMLDKSDRAIEAYSRMQSHSTPTMPLFILIVVLLTTTKANMTMPSKTSTEQ